MKQTVRIFAIILIIVLFTGCTANPVSTTNAIADPTTDPTAQTIGSGTVSIVDTIKNDFHGDVSGDWKVRRNRTVGALSDEGYYHTAPEGFLYFYDPASAVSVRLCSDVNCLHEEETNYELYENCEAFIGNSWMIDTLFFTNETLYYIEMDYYGTNLYSRDPAGMQEKKVASLARNYGEPDRNLIVNDALVHNGKLYYTVDVEGSVWHEEEQVTYIELEFSVICCLDLQTGEETELVRSLQPKERLLLAAVSDNAIVYSVTRDIGTEDSPNVINTVVLHSTEGKGSRILLRPKSSFTAHFDVHDGAFYLEEEAADGTFSFVGYDLVTSEVVYRSQLPAKDMQYLNKEYRLHYTWGGSSIISIYNISTGEFLDGSVEGRGATIYNVNDTGFIMLDRVLAEGSTNKYKEQRMFFCSFASLEDGFQQEDLQLILTIGNAA